MKRAFLLVIIAFFLLDSAVVSNATVNVSAKSAIVIDAHSGRVLFEKNAYEKRGMASTTKIMTALLVLEKGGLEEMVSVSPNAAGTEGSSIWLAPSEKISVNDLLYGLMLASGNDAATALAEHTAGSVEAFTLLMNRKAKEIGAYNTNFTNPHGLPDKEHYTTAYDLALIAREAMKNKQFASIVATKNKTISWEGSEWKRSLGNHNKLLKRYEYATGIKTGFTKKDGRCLVSSAEKDGRLHICVTLNAPDDWNDHIAMHEYCFETFKAHTVCKGGNSAGIFKNDKYECDDVKLLFEFDFVVSLKEDEKDKIKIKKSLSVNYPVTEGQKVGRADIFCGEVLLGSVDLISGNDAYIKEVFTSVFIKLAKGILKQ